MAREQQHQPSLFETDGQAAEQPVRIGHAHIDYQPTGSILTKATGFMSDYDYTLNPYAGCSFGCTYCYAAFFARDAGKRASWGEWLTVKENAVDRLRRMRTDLSGATVYMSSVTDPYQPIERRVRLVRKLLEVLAAREARLVVQTRSPLVARDIDLFRRFRSVQVNMTVTTDSEEARRAMEPHCPTTKRRLEGIGKVAGAGIPSVITMTPLLPVVDPERFAESLLATGVERFVVQPFHGEGGRFVAGTREPALALIDRLGWTSARYREVVEVLRARLPELREGREGFAPP